MKALEILKEQYNMLSKDIDGVWIDPEKIDEAIKELEKYESDMDSYLDYTTGSRCTKSFNSCLGSIKIAYEKDLEKTVKENSEDRLAELEKVILDYYLNKGYKINVGGWGVKVNISTYQKQKEIQIMFRKNRKSNYETVFRIWQKTTKEMFDKAFEFFSIKEQELNKEFKVFQGDRFSPPFVVKTFKTKKEADDFVEATQKESSKYDEYTAFWVEEVNG